MPVGTVKFVNTQKGFDFIAPEDGSSDVFVHQRCRAGWHESPYEGQRVSFNVVTDQRRGETNAQNLKAV